MISLFVNIKYSTLVRSMLHVPHYALCLVVSALVACSPIGDDERLIRMEKAPVKRAVLIEDFTGQRCVNCPNATDLIEELQKQYGAENVIAVGMHCEPLGFAGNASNVGLMNEESRAYGQHWQVESQPTGLVNRRRGLLKQSDWATDVYEEVKQSSPVQIEMDAAYDEAAKSANIDVKVTALQDINGKLQLWLVQDSIVAMQVVPSTGKADRDYVHNHVFRACVNGQWGDEISIADGQIHEASYAVSLDNGKRPQFSPEYVPENCSIVAFVYDDGGVMQVVKARLNVK